LHCKGVSILAVEHANNELLFKKFLTFIKCGKSPARYRNVFTAELSRIGVKCSLIRIPTPEIPEILLSIL
jgi:hypothetical protein